MSDPWSVAHLFYSNYTQYLLLPSEWKREHAEADSSDHMLNVSLMGLKPNHRYAVYVETDTVADADIGARSNITYTITKPYSEFHHDSFVHKTDASFIYKHRMG